MSIQKALDFINVHCQKHQFFINFIDIAVFLLFGIQGAPGRAAAAGGERKDLGRGSLGGSDALQGSLGLLAGGRP